MGLTKNLENGAKIVLLYAKEFNWKNEKEKLLLGNEPTTGKVYRALRDERTNAYYVSIEQGFKFGAHGIRLSELVYKNNEFECEMVELTDDNIIDFEISPEDYKQINHWMEEDHKSFIAKLEGQNGLDVVIPKSDDIQHDTALTPNQAEEQEKIEELGKKVMDALKASVDAFESTAGSAINEISRRDPWMLEVVSNLLVYLNKVLDKEDSSPTMPFAKEIATNEDLGMGANIYTAVASIENYINYSDRIGGNKNSLHKAIYHLLLELTRLKMEETHGNNK